MPGLALPLVSIIIPTYNQRPDYLEQAILSAVSQEYENIEVIISNNHTTISDSLAILDKYKDHPRCRIVCPVQFLPLTENFAFGASCATGKYITFLSSDDYYFPNLISVLVPHMELDSSIAMAYGKTNRETESGISPVIDTHYSELTGKAKFDDIYIRYLRFHHGATAALLFRRDVYDKVGGISYQGIHFAADVFLSIRCLLHGDAYYDPATLGVVRWTYNEEREARTLALIKDRKIVYDYLAGAPGISDKIRNDMERVRKKYIFDEYFRANLYYLKKKKYGIQQVRLFCRELLTLVDHSLVKFLYRAGGWFLYRMRFYKLVLWVKK